MGKYSGKYSGQTKPAKKQKPRKKMNKVLLGILIFFLILILLIVAVVWFLWAKLDLIEFEDEIDKSVYSSNQNLDLEDEESEEIVDISGLEMVDGDLEIPDSEIWDEENVLNILLIGTDERTKEFNVNARSDSMILVSIDKDYNTVKLVSLERGIAAPILEGQYAGQYDWLTHVFRYGGSDLLVKTVEYCFKVDVDHYVRVNFNSVTQVVDAIGGIDMTLTKSEANALNKGSDIDLKEGVNHLDGATALSFARLRSIDSDWNRVARQRKVILAVVDALKGSSLLDLNNLADQVLPLIQTNLTKMEIAELVLYAPNFLQAEFDQMTIPKQGTYRGKTVMGGRGSFYIDFEVNNDLLHRFLYEAASSEDLLAE